MEISPSSRARNDCSPPPLSKSVVKDGYRQEERAPSINYIRTLPAMAMVARLDWAVKFVDRSMGRVERCRSPTPSYDAACRRNKKSDWPRNAPSPRSTHGWPRSTRSTSKPGKPPCTTRTIVLRPAGCTPRFPLRPHPGTPQVGRQAAVQLRTVDLPFLAALRALRALRHRGGCHTCRAAYSRDVRRDAAALDRRRATTPRNRAVTRRTAGTALRSPHGRGRCADRIRPRSPAAPPRGP